MHHPGDLRSQRRSGAAVASVLAAEMAPLLTTGRKGTVGYCRFKSCCKCFWIPIPSCMYLLPKGGARVGSSQ